MDANLLFDAFVSASQFTRIQQLFNQMCACLHIDPYDSSNLYKRLKSELTEWRAKKLWTLLDRRAEHKEYCDQKACNRLNVLVIGAGPCGLRAAIECALLGAHTVLVEQRDRFSRNNVLHIWPFVIHDLKHLGIKIFYPKFCRGSIDHISIRQLQCVLLKVALVLGVQVHDSVAFHDLIFPKPDDKGKVLGWRAEFDPPGHILSDYVFDALIGADGKRNTVPGFPKREMRGKLAIGITANFVNGRTLDEEKVQEISGVAYIFNQHFFKEMKEVTGVDLENIVYYKDETHYFVMCAKKQSLLEKGVIIEDNEDVSQLLAATNVDQEKLCDYARSAADFATSGRLPELEFALNHNGREDVAMFDFTSLFSAQCSVRLVERHNYRLLMAIVGDSLHEPFWPTGSGVARGFLGVLDAAWMLRSYGLNREGLMITIAERESAYRLLAQAKPDNLHKQLHKYTIDPRTRYVSLELSVQPYEVSHLVDTDNPRNVPTNKALPLRAPTPEEALDSDFLNKYKLWRFCQQALQPYKLKMFNMASCWADGRALAALLGRFRPDLVDYISLCCANDPDTLIQTSMNAAESALGVAAPCTNATEWAEMGDQRRLEYVRAIVESLKQDETRMRDSLLRAIRASTLAFKHSVDASSSGLPTAKKADDDEPKVSEELPEDGITPAKPTVTDFQNGDRLVEDFLEGRISGLEEQQIREALAELNADEVERKGRHAKRVKELEKRIEFSKRASSTDSAVKPFTKRPAVDKLDPIRLHAVEKIVTGEVEAERTRELYRNKRRQASIMTRKMDKRDIDEMESKLEQTAMGLLFNRDQFRVLSSKEQKIMSANAAAARQVAQEGFKKDDDKYKDIDEKLSKANSLLKNQNLAGVDTVSRLLHNGTLHSTEAGSSVEVTCRHVGKPPPPTPTKRAQISPYVTNISESAQENVRSRVPISEALPGGAPPRRPVSMPLVESSYESVSARREQCCRLCLRRVYLAERMLLDGMFIHKKCFRCAFCEQPLRIGHCAQDRNLDLPLPKYFCMQHINVSVHEKMARIEKLDKHTKGGASTSLENSPSTFSRPPNGFSPSSSTVATSNAIEKPSAMPSRLRELNSPAALLDKTMGRLRSQQEAAAVSRLATGLTPERVEFETFKRKLRADLDARRRARSLSASSEEETEPSADDPSGTAPRAPTATEEESSSDEEDEFMEAELIELEKAVVENIDKNLNDTLSDAQAVKLLKAFNERRKTDLGEFDCPPESAQKKNAECSPAEKPLKLPSGGERQERLLMTIPITTDAMPHEDDSSKVPRLMREQLSLDLLAESSHTGEGNLTVTHDGLVASDVCRHSEGHHRPPHSDASVSSPVAPISAAENAKSSLPRSGNSSSGRGLLARLFSVDTSRKKREVITRSSSEHRGPTNAPSASRSPPGLEAPLASPESDREGNLLERIANLKNLRHRKPNADVGPKGSGSQSDKLVPRAAVSPMPPAVASSSPSGDHDRGCTPILTSGFRSSSASTNESLKDDCPTSPFSVTEKNIRRVQKRAEQIAKQKEQERVRCSQDIQRALQETEIRKAEVASVGADLERRLCEDGENRWVLEQWLLYVHEMEQLKQREEELQRRVREMEAVHEYKYLQLQLKQVQDAVGAVERGGNGSNEKDLLKRMLEVIEKRDVIQQEMEKANRAARRAAKEPQAVINEKGASYRNFCPVFLK